MAGSFLCSTRVYKYGANTLPRKGRFEFRIYTSDHEPAQVHVIKGGAEVAINLGKEDTKPWIRINRGMKKKEIRQALRLVAIHQEHLLRE